MSQNLSLENVTHWRELKEQSKLFKTDDSIRWFIRRFQSELVEAGVIIKISNQWHMIRPEFDAVAIELCRKDAKRAEKAKAAA